MAIVYVEARPKGGGPIQNYVVEDHADTVLGTFDTQHEAIEWAKKNRHSPHVARVRHLNDKKKPDHWRAV
jgi:hypothetical protein